MSKKKELLASEEAKEGRKTKEVCCEKYLKKGKHCKGCPLTAAERQPK